MIETTSADATRDGRERSAKPLTLKVRRCFLSTAAPPARRPPLLEKARRGERKFEWQEERKFICG